MLKYGCTRLEIGVQSVYEDVARDTNRYSAVASMHAVVIEPICSHIVVLVELMKLLRASPSKRIPFTCMDSKLSLCNLSDF